MNGRASGAGAAAGEVQQRGEVTDADNEGRGCRASPQRQGHRDRARKNSGKQRCGFGAEDAREKRSEAQVEGARKTVRRSGTVRCLSGGARKRVLQGRCGSSDNGCPDRVPCCLSRARQPCWFRLSAQRTGIQLRAPPDVGLRLENALQGGARQLQSHVGLRPRQSGWQVDERPGETAVARNGEIPGE